MAVSTALDAVRLGSSEVAAVYLGSDSVWTANAPGIVLVKPTSITHSGTSATLGANGQVTFTSVESVSLNGIFTSDFDNYVVSCRLIADTLNINVFAKLRSSGTDAVGADYTWQRLQANGTARNATRTSGVTKANVAEGSATAASGFDLRIYGPALTQPTAMRSTTIMGRDGARLVDFASTHSLSTSYDGLTIAMDAGFSYLTGALQVYGVRS